MPTLHVNWQPIMTRYLVESGVFTYHPFRLVDVGAAGGYETFWDVWGADLNVIGFEPRRSECDALNASRPKNVIYIPYAVSDKSGSREFHITRQPQASSFCSGETGFMRRFLEEHGLQTVEKVEFQTRRLDDVLKDAGADHVDFIKIDVDGAELDVLSGATETLRDSSTLGLVTEFWLHHGMRNGCSVFSQIDRFMIEMGFRLYDIDVYRHCRKVLPHPSRTVVHGRSRIHGPGPTAAGQVMTGDALYLRDYVGDFSSENLDLHQILKLACAYEIYGLEDCATELILHWRQLLNKITDTSRLLDMLTEGWTGKKISYCDYVRNGCWGPDARPPLLIRAVPFINSLLRLISRYRGKLVPILGAVVRRVFRRVSTNPKLNV